MVASAPVVTSGLEPAAAPAAPALPSPTPVPPTPVPPSPTLVPQVTVPDLHGLSEKDIKRMLEEVGLVVGSKKDACTGADQGDPKAKRGRVLCQNPAAGQLVAPGSMVEYVLAVK